MKKRLKAQVVRLIDAALLLYDDPDWSSGVSDTVSSAFTENVGEMTIAARTWLMHQTGNRAFDDKAKLKAHLKSSGTEWYELKIIAHRMGSHWSVVYWAYWLHRIRDELTGDSHSVGIHNFDPMTWSYPTTEKKPAWPAP